MNAQPKQPTGLGDSMLPYVSSVSALAGAMRVSYLTALAIVEAVNSV